MNIKEVAAKAGVSITTVSRVMNMPEKVNSQTRAKVVAVMEELNYTPNWFARNIQTTRTNQIGVVITEMLEESNMKVAKGIESIAKKNDANLIICSTGYDREAEKEIIDSLIDRNIDGLILVNTMLHKSELKRIRGRKIPIVLIGKPDYVINENIVYTNYDAAAEEVVDYLFENKRRRIALLLAKNQTAVNKEKLAGYRKSLEKHGIAYDAEIVLETDYSIEGGYISTAKLLESSLKVDAIFAANDTLAFGVIEKLNQEGLTSEDIAVIGYDNLEAGAVISPKLTTVIKPSYRMGLTACRLLFDIIEADSSVEAQAIMLHSKLKIRKSCGNKERIREIW